MAMKKWKKRLIWIGSSLIVLLMFGYFGMDIAMSYVLQSMIPQVPIEINGQAYESDSLVSATDAMKSTDNGEGTKLHSVESPVPEAKQGEVNSQHIAAPSTSSSSGTSSKRDDDVSTTNSSGNSSGASQSGQTTTQTQPVSKDKFSYQAQVSSEKAKEVQDAITLKEKASVTSVLLKK